MLASALHQQTAPYTCSCLMIGVFPTQGTHLNEGHVCVSLSLITLIHQLAKCAPLFSPVGLNKKKKIQ